MGGKRSIDLPAPPVLRVSPKIADNIFSPGLDADFHRTKKECLVHRICIENGDCARAIGQRFHDNLEAILLAHALALLAERVLIDSDDFAVAEYFKRPRTDLAQIGTDYQWRRHYGPQTELCSVLGPSHATISDLKKVWVVPVTRAREHIEHDVFFIVLAHRVELVFDIAGRTPRARSDFGVLRPQPWLVLTPLAQAIEKLVPGHAQCFAHSAITFLCIHFLVIAIVVFDVVDAQQCKQRGVLLFMT